MKLIIGLGNPGVQYENTRHNIGFKVIDACSKAFGITLDQAKFKGVFGYGIVNGEKVFLLKPLTYMNLSGESVRPLMDYYKIAVEDIIVVYDDLDLDPGKIRLRQKGSAGGHNGIKSLIAHLGTSEFNRIRVGIGRPVGAEKVVNYVLGNFTKEEQSDIESAILQATKACETALSSTFLNVMNQFN